MLKMLTIASVAAVLALSLPALAQTTTPEAARNCTAKGGYEIYQAEVSKQHGTQYRAKLECDPSTYAFFDRARRGSDGENPPAEKK